MCACLCVGVCVIDTNSFAAEQKTFSPINVSYTYTVCGINKFDVVEFVYVFRTILSMLSFVFVFGSPQADITECFWFELYSLFEAKTQYEKSNCFTAELTFLCANWLLEVELNKRTYPDRPKPYEKSYDRPSARWRRRRWVEKWRTITVTKVKNKKTNKKNNNNIVTTPSSWWHQQIIETKATQRAQHIYTHTYTEWEREREK